jgi:hypothetical protein
MSEKPKHYWMSPLNDRDALPDEVNGDPDFITTRRSFLKAAGFSVIGAVAASCSRAPVPSAIPYVQQPEELIPGDRYLRVHATLRGALWLACHHSGWTANKDRRQSRSSPVERFDMRGGAGIDSWFI